MKSIYHHSILKSESLTIKIKNNRKNIKKKPLKTLERFGFILFIEIEWKILYFLLKN